MRRGVISVPRGFPGNAVFSMVFNSLHFAAFLPIVLLGFVLLRHRLTARNAFLLLASWYFYGSWAVFVDWRFLLLLLGTQTWDFTMARLLESHPIGSGRRKLFVVASCVVNLGVLAFFKYTNFAVDSVNTIAHYMGWNWLSARHLNVILPVGISFYTFQSIAYVIDVYRGYLRAERSPLHYMLFVAFFPQLVAGPIERATHLLPQVKSRTELTWDNACHGAWLIGLGLFKKVVLAENVAKVVRAVYDVENPLEYPQWWETVLGTYAFALQIYCDFSAYSDIARGVARVMGFELMRNFDLPYFATNPSDFWRRWHISLSTWLRDYLYIPLGGNRCGRWRTYLNLFLTMTIGGLWHGATWLFVLWGIYHGLMLCVHRALKPILDRYFAFQGRPQAALWTAIRIVIFFQFTCIGWMLFVGGTVQNLNRLLTPFYQSVTPSTQYLKPEHLLTLCAVALAVFIPQLVKYVKNDHDVIFRIPVPIRALVYAGMIIGFIVYGEFGGGDFIYFQF